MMYDDGAMEPRIQYCTASDGVSIAYYTLGEGAPLVFMPMLPVSSIDMEWENPWQRRWYQRLTDAGMVIRYDNRGSGLSERAVTDLSVDAMIRDLEAVVDHLGFHRFALAAWGSAGPTAITFAARRSERLSHLILWEAAANKNAFEEMPGFQTVLTMLDGDWDIFTETICRVALGWDEPVAHEFARLMRAALTRDTYKAFLGMTHDASSLLREVKIKTLVAHERGSGVHVIELAKELAAAIPTSQLLVVDVGEHGMPSEQAIQAMVDFVGKEGTPPENTEISLPQGTAVILLLDIADSTALTTRLGDAGYREKERELDTTLRAAIRDSGGRPVEGKLLGDGIMSVFTSAREAIGAALRCKAAGEAAGFPLHLGTHAGDVIRDGNDVHGGAVQVAARVASAAAPGELLVSQTVRDLARTSAGVSFEDRGEHELKGIAEPVRLFAVRREREG